MTSSSDELSYSTTSPSSLDFDLEFGSEFLNFTALNETDIFNGTTNRYHGDQSIPMLHDVGFENRLENGSRFMDDVEELFAASSSNQSASVRMRRHLPSPLNFKREGKGTIYVTCSNIGGFTSSRERWWYIAIANCGSGKGLDVTYRFRMTNGAPGDFWHEHFSADEMCKTFQKSDKNNLYVSISLDIC